MTSSLLDATTIKRSVTHELHLYVTLPLVLTVRP